MEVLLERTEDLNKLTGPGRVKTRPVEYWKGSATDQEDAYGTDTESSLMPPGTLRSDRGLSICTSPTASQPCRT